MVYMSFDRYNSTLVLNMMRGLSYLPGLGLGCRQHGPHEFTFIVDHDRLHSYKGGCMLHGATVQGQSKGPLFGVPFDYPLRPYTF